MRPAASHGVYGWDTDKAVRAFQQMQGLSVTGIWSQAERSKVNQVLAQTPTSPKVPPAADIAALWIELDSLRTRETAILRVLRGAG